MIWIGGVAVVLGVLTIVVGMRGRLNEHPVCRKCGFDLFGTLPDRGTCPECGADLGNAGSVRVGERRRRPRVVAGGVLILGMGLAIGGAAGWGAATGFDWNTVKPSWLLVRQMPAAEAFTQTAIAKELSGRMAKGSLPAGAARAAIDRALDVQLRIVNAIERREFHDDHFRAPFQDWLNVIEASVGAQLIAPDQVVRYAKQGLHAWAGTRPRSPLGEALPVHCALVDNCGVMSEKTTIGIRYSLRVVDLNGSALAFEDDVPMRRPQWNFLARWSNAKTWLAGPVGPARLKLAWDVEVYLPWKDEAAGVFTALFETPLEVTPAGTPVVSLITDLESKGAVDQSVGSIRILGEGTQDDYDYLTFSIQFDSVPVAIAGRVLLECQGRRWDVGWASQIPRPEREGPVTMTWSIPKPEGFVASEPMTLIIVPDEGIAMEWTDAVEIWGRDIVIPGVHVEWYSPARKREAEERQNETLGEGGRKHE